VAFIGGGYDANQDNDPTTEMDQKGRGIYVVDIDTGEKIWRYTNSEDPENMIYSIPSDIAKVDTNGDGKIDRLYVGDMGGRMWRFDIGDPNPTNWTAKIIFKSNPDPPGTNDRRKIFYPADVSLEMDTAGNYEMLYFGTGDREAPKENAVSNRLYALKDKNPDPTTPYQEATDLLNVTSGNPDLGDLNSKNGWYIILGTSGEKSLSAPVVFFKTVYFTTFTSSVEGQADDPCYVGEGTARLYAVKSTTGNAAFNFDLTNDLSEPIISTSDRSKIIGTAIPSNVIITFIGGTAIAYSGVGGGIVKPQLSGTSPLVPMNWRIVF
jgi:type IV pilus assembly protein PilY1